MNEKELIEKVCDSYLNSDKGIDEQAREFKIGRDRYKKIIKENFQFAQVLNSKDAWELFKVQPEEAKFYRMIGQSMKSGKIHLLGLVLSNEELRTLVEIDGISVPEIIYRVNMPFVSKEFLGGRINRLGFNYKKEDIKSNRAKGLKKVFSDENRVKKMSEKRKKTNIERFGVENPMQSREVQKKQRRTVMERFGVPVSTMNMEIQKKQQATSLKNNGVPFPSQNKDIYEKVIKTNLERYGSYSYMVSKRGREVSKNSMLSKYGVPYMVELESIRALGNQAIYTKYGTNSAFSDKKVQEKSKITLKKNYGVSYPTQSKIIQDRIKQTSLKRYGVTYAMQSKEVKEKVFNTNISRYGFSSYNKSNMIFTPTEYVHTKEQAIAITSTPETLKEFLYVTFPNKKTFTLHEVALITGRPYNTIKVLFSTHLDFIAHSTQGHLPELIQGFLEELGYEPTKDFIMNDRQAIRPLEIDFYFPKEKVGIEVNDFWTHNSTVNPFGGPVKSKTYHMEKSKLAKEKGIRLIHAWEHYFSNEDQLNVLKNAIKHALGVSKNRVYARNTYVKEVPNVSLKQFFNKNNIQGFRGAKTAYALFDKKTDEVLMAYSVGSSHFAHNKYDLELIRGASKLDTTIVGGASKLWKFIISVNPDINSIVYYIDRNIYNGSSIGSLEGHLELVNTQPGFWNYFVEEDQIKNRQPSKHKEIKELVKAGKVWEVYNAGTETYVWTR